MDHLWQITHNGPPEHAMLEAYTTLGYLAARTTRIQLLALVTAVVYREPGLLAKAVTTLDVLSEGRAWLGIAAAAGLVALMAGALAFRMRVRDAIPWLLGDAAVLVLAAVTATLRAVTA